MNRTMNLWDKNIKSNMYAFDWTGTPRKLIFCVHINFMNGWMTQSNWLQQGALKIYFFFYLQTRFNHSTVCFLLEVCIPVFFFNRKVRLLICGFVSTYFLSLCIFKGPLKHVMVAQRLNKPKHINQYELSPL